MNFPPEMFIVRRSISARLFSSAVESGRLRTAMGITQGNDHAPHNPAENSEALHALNDTRTSRCGTSARSCKLDRDNLEAHANGVAHALVAVEMHTINTGP